MLKLHPVWVVNAVLVIWIVANGIPNLNIETVILPPDAIMPDGSKYYGDLVDGKAEGDGQLLFLNGDKYTGSFKGGLINGKGHFSLISGDELKAVFKDGFAHGEGLYKYANGMLYKGEFEKGYPQGQGKIEFIDKSVYEGEFHLGYEHGDGVYRFANGDYYEGKFKKGRFIEGTHIDSFGNRYEGEFENNLYHGKGSYFMEGGESYVGYFIEGLMQGKGEHKTIEGGHYIGNFQDMTYHGEGKYISTEGNIYEGEFEFGLFHGEGKYTYRNEDGKELVQEGQWEWGVFKDENERKIYPEIFTADDALYNQNILLEESFKSITVNDPDKVESYFLGVAGDGAQDVFLKELEEVEEHLKARFPIENKSLLLINNVKVTEEYPLATKMSLINSIKSIAEKMDTENDILFLYMTSHGSRDHVFYINDKRFKLNGISSQELTQILDESNIKWRVIIISACFSGGFIESLKNDTTLVMTSARADRQSFGCSNDSDMTYFGKALFREAFPMTESLTEAFNVSLDHIKKWEIELEVEEHSEPQIFVGKDIESHLAQIERKN